MPHLKALVERHENDDFELIGINTGDAPDVYRRGLDKHGVSWLSAYQGKTSPIANLFKVRGYPTYFVIDVDGTISYTGHSGSFDALVADLLEKAKERADDEEGEGDGDGSGDGDGDDEEIGTHG